MYTAILVPMIFIYVKRWIDGFIKAHKQKSSSFQNCFFKTIGVRTCRCARKFCTIGHVDKVRKKMIERAGVEKLEFFFVGTQIEQSNCHKDTNLALATKGYKMFRS